MRISRLAVVALACAAGFIHSLPARPADAAGDTGGVVGLGSVGRMVADLDRSVAFYQAIGFRRDPAVDSAWRKDPVVEQLYNATNIETRVAKMFVNNSASGQRFVVYLRELKGIKRRNLTGYTPWEPGATHFGLIVPDAEAVWSGLKARGMLRARSWEAKLIAPPGQTKGMLAYMTDPDGIDIEIIEQRPGAPAENGRPARAALVPGVNHVGAVFLDSDKARAFYGDLLGGRPLNTEAPWLQGDFYDSAVGGHGNIIRLFNVAFPEASAPASTARVNFEIVEYQNRRKAISPYDITDIGVAYVGFEVTGIEAFLERAQAAGAKVVSNGIVTMKSGTREVMVRDGDVGSFVLLYEHPEE